MSRSARNSWLKGYLLALLVGGGAAQAAPVAISVPDASQLAYQGSSDGRIYLRNINSFESQALGCCYNYYIDTKITFLPDSYAVGAVTYGGDF